MARRQRTPGAPGQEVPAGQTRLFLSFGALTLLAFSACRRLRLSDAAVIGTMMIPIYFYPSNYYLHILFIWPLMLAAWKGSEREVEWSLVAAIVLAACAVQWFGWLIPGNYGQFLFWSGDLLVAIVLVLLVPVVGDRLRATSETV